jgi:hypothetical protein
MKVSVIHKILGEISLLLSKKASFTRVHKREAGK